MFLLRLRAVFEKRGRAKYISHLDLNPGVRDGSWRFSGAGLSDGIVQQDRKKELSHGIFSHNNLGDIRQ